jgi:O-antigen biosynthesis protein
VDVSIVIVSFNVREYLRNCLYSVRKASEGLNTEIIIVDNNSSDRSAGMVASDFPEAILITNTTNRGFAAACNQGIKLSVGRFVLLLNPDTIIEPDCLRKSIEFMDSHPGAGILGARLSDGEGRFLPESKRAFPSPSAAFFKITGLNRLFPLSPVFNRYYYPALKPDQTGRVDVIPGAFMFIEGKTLETVGIFDEEYFMYGEDIEMSYKASLSGLSNYYCHNIHVTHFKGRSTPKDGFSNISHFYEAMRIWTRKRDNEKPGIIHSIVIPSTYLFQAAAIVRRFLGRLFVSGQENYSQTFP